MKLRIGRSLPSSAAFEARQDQPPLGPSSIDQLLGGEARARAQVSEMALGRARPDTHKLGSVLDRPAGASLRVCGNG
jgi:hypothetical protein